MLTDFESLVLRQVRQGLASDEQISPFMRTERYYQRFEKANQDYIGLNEAPVNKPLLVITDSVGTFYQNGRGTGVSRGSLIVKRPDSRVEMLDSIYWYASGSGKAHTYPVRGIYELEGRTYGGVKELSKVNPV